MKHTHVPKLFIGLTIIFAALLLIGDRNVALGQSSATASSTQKYLSGFAWSSNIGWISMRGTNYAVLVSPTGILSGSAWSPNIGWVSFNGADLSSCPSGNGPCSPSINLQSGAVTGWARVCSGTKSKDCKGEDRTDGWQGWVHLSGDNHPSPQSNGKGGVTYLPSTARMKGFAWGGDVVGWIDFDGIRIGSDFPAVDPEEYGPVTDAKPPVITQFKMNPNTVKSGQSCTMFWEVEHAKDCNIVGLGYTADYDVKLPSGSDNTAVINSAQIYTLTCSNSAGSVSKSAACRLAPKTSED